MRWARASFLLLILLPSACASNAPPAKGAARDLRPKHVGLPSSLRYLGVAGWQLQVGSHSLLFDPYFTRADVKDGAAPLTPDETAIARYSPREADVILVGHSHYDHLLDVPSIAWRTHALVAGTASTVHVGAAAGLPNEQLRLVRPGERFKSGPFQVDVLRGLHSLVGVPSVEIPVDISVPLSADAYGEGGTLQYLVEAAGHRILFIGSANFVESELVGRAPDVAIVATGLRNKVPDYTCRLMHALGEPPLVLTNHFDAHWQPLGPEQMSIGDEGRADLERFASEVRACSPDTKVVVPKHLETIPL